LAKGARQPQSVGRNGCPAEKGVARGVDARSHPRQVDAKQAFVALHDPPADNHGGDIPDVSALDNESFRIVHRYEIETVGVDEDNVSLLAGSQ
jgi:hypothetical protein